MNLRPRPVCKYLIAAAMAAMVATLLAAADPLVHVVKPGETLYGIARAYDVPVAELAKANTITDPSKLYAGMRITIPGKSASAPAAGVEAQTSSKPVEYVAKHGDTLFAIARAHGVAVDDIVKANGLASTSLRVGQRLLIPVKGAAASAAASGSGTSRSPASGVSAGASAAPSSIGSTTGSASAGTSAGSPSGEPRAATVSQAKGWPASGPVESLKGRLKGVSIAAGASAQIQAIRAGTVVSAGPFRGFNQVAFVQSADGLIYVYGGAVALAVKVGESVRRGTLIGRTGPGPDSSAYFFVFKGSDTIDPETVPRD